MKRADIPANCFAFGMIATAAVLAILAFPFVVLAYVLHKEQ
jgi:hypothetical protein